MTMSPLKPCKHPGCHEYAEQNGYCRKHFRERFSFYINEKRISPSKLGYGRKWDYARKEYLKQHPLCVVCGRPATEVDHIQPHKGNMLLFWNRNNWQSLCHSCHSKKTIKENGFYNVKDKETTETSCS